MPLILSRVAPEAKSTGITSYAMETSRCYRIDMLASESDLREHSQWSQPLMSLMRLDTMHTSKHDRG